MDGAYDKMAEAINADRTPNIVALHYDAEKWHVRDLVLIPRFSYTLSAIKKRNPLRATAKRHGWVGCSILIGEIPSEARIPVVSDGDTHSKKLVRERYSELRELGKMSVEARGWTLDVLKVVRSLGKEEFNLKDVYEFEDELLRPHPANRNIQPKIRQQLQKLRNMNILQFLGSGHYRFR
jgi:type II restriction enzyme